MATTLRRANVAGGAVVVCRTWTLNSQYESVTTAVTALRRSAVVPA
jgi:hypothetical protein